MKRKDTKCYKELVEKYCSSRLGFENAEDLISNAEKVIEKSQRKYTEIDNGDSMINAWFHTFMFMCRSNILMSKENKRHYGETMERCGKLLMDDYDEDLEKLYDNYEAF